MAKLEQVELLWTLLEMAKLEQKLATRSGAKIGQVWFSLRLSPGHPINQYMIRVSVPPYLVFRCKSVD